MSNNVNSGRSAKKRAVIDISDDESNQPPVKKEVEPVPSQEMLDLQQKVTKLEKDKQSLIRIAGEAQARVEYLENLIDKKPAAAVDGEEKQVLQKRVDELTNERDELVNKLGEAEEKAKKLAEKQQKKIDELARKLDAYEGQDKKKELIRNREISAVHARAARKKEEIDASNNADDDGLSMVPNFTAPILAEPKEEVKDSQVKCVLCEEYPKTAYGYADHLKSAHKSTLNANKIYLLCACGFAVRSHHRHPNHIREDDCRQFTVCKIRDEVHSTVQCIKCEEYPKTAHGYAYHLYNKHKSTLNVSGIHLLCSCGFKVRSVDGGCKHSKEMRDEPRPLVATARVKTETASLTPATSPTSSPTQRGPTIKVVDDTAKEVFGPTPPASPAEECAKEEETSSESIEQSFGMGARRMSGKRVACVLQREPDDWLVEELDVNGRPLRAIARRKPHVTEVAKPPFVRDKWVAACTRVYNGASEQEEIDIDEKELPPGVWVLMKMFARRRYKDALRLDLYNVTKSQKRMVVKRGRATKFVNTHALITLRKRNTDMNAAVRSVMQISRGVEVKYSSCMETRGVTVQRIAVNNLSIIGNDISCLDELGPGISVHDVKLWDRELLKPLSTGRRYTIVIRDVKASAVPKLLHRLAKWKSRGFPNYFCPNQFEYGAYSAVAGAAMLLGEWRKAAEALLKRRRGTDRLQLVIDEWKKTGVVKVKKINDEDMKTLPGMILNCIHRGASSETFATHIMQPIRDPCIEAYLCTLWNRAAGARVCEFDAIRADRNADKVPETAEKCIITPSVPNPPDLDPDWALRPLQGPLATSVQACSSLAPTKISPFDIHIPVLRADYERNAETEYVIDLYSREMASDGIGWDDVKKLQKSVQKVQPPLPRPLFVRPKNVEWIVEECGEKESGHGKRDSYGRKKEEKKTSVVSLRFDLPVDSYGSVALREVVTTDRKAKKEKSIEDDYDNWISKDKSAKKKKEDEEPPKKVSKLYNNDTVVNRKIGIWAW